jgi:hypothetical protein
LGRDGEDEGNGEHAMQAKPGRVCCKTRRKEKISDVVREMT